MPLDIQIHEGGVFSNRDKRTLLDKLVTQVLELGLAQPSYLVVDAYYAKGKTIKGMLTQAIIWSRGLAPIALRIIQHPSEKENPSAAGPASTARR